MQRQMGKREDTLSYLASKETLLPRENNKESRSGDAPALRNGG